MSSRKYFAIDCPIGFLAKIKPVLYAHTIYSFSVFRSQNRFRFDYSEIRLKMKCIWIMLVFSIGRRIYLKTNPWTTTTMRTKMLKTKAKRII